MGDKEHIKKLEDQIEENFKTLDIKISNSKIELIFELEAKAKKTGGDKYKCTTNEDFTIYVPQEISRSVAFSGKKLSGEIKKTLKITIESD
jgi:hypothetical protein